MFQDPEQKNDKRKSAAKIDPKVLLEALEIARELQRVVNENKQDVKVSLGKNRELLFKLLEYLILNADNPNIDKSLITFLAKVLGINLNLHKKKEKNKEHEEEKEEELSKEEKERRHRLIIYEVYKILNPHRLAGETSLENFINNVKTRGIEEARKYEGANYEQDFKKKDLENLESNRFSFVENLKNAGFKGKGKGI